MRAASIETDIAFTAATIQYSRAAAMRAATISDITVYEQVSIFHTTFFVYGNQIKKRTFECEY